MYRSGSSFAAEGPGETRCQSHTIFMNALRLVASPLNSHAPVAVLVPLRIRQRLGEQKLGSPIYCAAQMASCRMAPSKRCSACQNSTLVPVDCMWQTGCSSRPGVQD